MDVRPSLLALSLLGGLAACGPSEPAPLLFPEGAQTALVVSVDVGAVRAQLADLTRTSALFVEARGRMTALFYARPLAEWALDEGDVELVPTGRALEPFEDAFELEAGAERWQPIDQLTPELVPLRLPAFDPIACVDAGRSVGPEEQGPRPEEQGQRWCLEARPIDPVAAPAEPEAPRPLELAACPEGWAPSDPFGGLCRPPARRQDCAPNEAQWLGRAACERIGDPCPVDRWPEALRGRTDVLFVDAQAGPGGSGTEAAPFSSLVDALAAVSTTATIALGPGRYRLGGRIDVDVVLVGACVEQTVIEADPADLMLHTSAYLEARNLALEGGRHGVLAVGALAEVRLMDLAIRGDASTSYAIWIRQGARAGIERVNVSNRVGLAVDGGSDVFASDFVTAGDSGGAALGLSEGSTGRFERLVVSARDILPLGSPGVVLSLGGSDLRMVEAWIQHEQMNGLWVAESSTLAASDLWVSDVRGTEERTNDGNGIFVTESSSASIVRAGFESHEGQDVVGRGRVHVSLDDFVSISTKHRGLGSLVALEGARVSVRRALVQASGKGVELFGGAEVEVDDLILRTRLTPEDGNGFVVRDGTHLVGRRWRLEPEAGTGLLVDTGGVAELSDIRILGTTAGIEGGGFAGMHFADGRGSLTRADLDLDGQRGLAIKFGIHLEDVRVQGDLDFGLRIDAPAGAEPVTASRLEVLEENGVGVEVIGGTRFTAEDLRVEGGIAGVRVSETARADLRRFLVERVEGRGVVLFDDMLTAGTPQLALDQGRIASCELGLALPEIGEQTAALLEGVRFDTNRVNVALESEP